MDKFTKEHLASIRNLIKAGGVSDAGTINKANEGLDILDKHVNKKVEYCRCAYPNFGPAGVCKKCGKNKA